MKNSEKQNGLPENAFRELRKGEQYEPLMQVNGKYKEITIWSILWGVLMAIIFSAASAYLGLKVGQVFEAAIPIAIIAIGVTNATHRKGALGENVMIQSIGACSGMIVAGAIFTLPALYILKEKYPEITVNFIEVFIASVLGGILGILFLIPFRKYFVKDMHGKYPFPEATASTQVLVSGENGGNQAFPLLVAGVVGGIYDFIIATTGWWNESVTSRCFQWGQILADKTKFIFKINTGAAILGMGYIIGLKYALIICYGSITIWWIIVPAISWIFPELIITEGGAHITAANASAEQIFQYAKSIGIGGIAMAGIIGIFKSRKIIIGAIGLTTHKMQNKGESDILVPRTQRDLSMKIIMLGSLATLVATLLFFYFGVMKGNLLFTLTGVLLVAVITFLFTTVAANAIAIVGSNPVSGMTLMTLILASVIMVAVGLKGPTGMVAALIMGGVVCTALSTAGSFITDLKIGYWLGSTPHKQETYKFLGTLVSAATVAGVIKILNDTYGFTNGQLAAPQANAMAAVIEPLMSGSNVPWLLYSIGAVIAIILTIFNVSALAFALGMFIPIELNLPLLVGGLINWFITTRNNNLNINKKRGEKGTLIASGFIAGGALMGVVSAALRFGGITFEYSEWWNNPASEWLAALMYILLIIYMIKASMNIDK